MRMHTIPPFLPKLYPKRIWRVNTKGNELFLTFDDGPSEEITQWILNVLSEYSAKATFFCVGANVEKYPLQYEQILKKGHAVGNHTFHHLKGWKSPKQTYVSDALKCRELVKSALFRPPYGKMTQAQSSALIREGFKPVMWSYLTYDFQRNIDKEKVWQHIKKNISKGEVIVFHDHLKAFENLQFLLPRTLEHFSKKGYSFKAL